VARQAVKAKAEDLQALIQNRIEKLRPKLLDLSRRNPLISTSLAQRSNSVIRVVDELPDDLVQRILNEGEMRFISLPALEEDPRDEKSKAFQNALSNALRSDETFLAAMEALDAKSDKAIEEGRRLERELRDRIRADLGMPTRQTGKDVSLPQHAQNNGILPSYELPKPEEEHKDGRHTDENIQTLFLPEDLERKLNALTTKCRSWAQETGINVLQAAFGFLEWTEPNKTDSAFAPLVLLPVEIEKKKTREGAEFWVRSASEEPQTNLVLAEKLRIEFGIALPPYQGGSLEQYMKEVASASPNTIKWKVRRQVAFGVFPSARMAMYNDLAIGKHAFANSEIISNLFGGSAPSGATPFADEYEVDQPEIESKVPALVMDADSSQFSTIVDIAKGKNLAVEGPPGTGKSQTIVNTIAAAISEGKKVLFIAEKTAALEVVKSRLEAVGLGEFLLPLQAERSNRKLISASLRARLEMSAGSAPPDYAAKIDWFKKTRAELAEYLAVIGKPFGTSGLTVYAVIGKSLVGNRVLEGMPKSLQRSDIKDVHKYDRPRIAELRGIGDATERAWLAAKAASEFWAQTTVLNVDKFSVDHLCDLAKDTASALEEVQQARAQLAQFGLAEEIEVVRLERLGNLLTKLNADLPQLDRALVVRLCRMPASSGIGNFLKKCVKAQEGRDALLKIVRDPSHHAWPQTLKSIAALCRDNEMNSVEPAVWVEQVSTKAQVLSSRRDLHAKLQPFVEDAPQFRGCATEHLAKAGRIVRAAGKPVLVLRAPISSFAATSTLLQGVCQAGAALSARREGIRTSFAIMPDAAPAAVLECARVIRGAGFFGRFGKKFQKAKKLYVAHAKSPFEKTKAAKELQEFSEWMQATSDYLNDPQTRALFGVHFKGLDTDFEAFKKLAQFYQAVDEAFPGQNNRDLRSFLKSGDLDSILLLPEAVENNFAGTFAGLSDAIVQLEAEVARLKVGVESIRPLVAGFVNLATMLPASLADLGFAIEESQRLCGELDSDERAKSILVNKWDGARTNVKSVAAEVTTSQAIKKEGGFTENLITWLEQSTLQDAENAVRKVLAREEAAARSTKELSGSSGVAFDKRLSGKVAPDGISYLMAASQDRAGLHTHSSYQTQRAELYRHGFGWVLDALEAEGRSLESLGAKIEAVIYRAMAIAVYAKHGSVLARYPGAKLDERRATLATLDREIIQLSRKHLRKKIHDAARPPPGIGQGKKSTWTQCALIENEANKVQGHIPLRELNERAGAALLELKPCWMMSPLAVAQYLPAGEVMFDLCIIDEASQMPPEDAIGALSRCKQAMIVGDTNQLPPTSFFRKMLDDDDVDEDEATLEESILELANGTFRPARRLRWHYRSRHSGLIAFSNEHVYGGDLIVFPSASEQHPDMGVSLVRVEGRYKTGINPPEASAMVEAALEFMRTQPDRSLGIVTLNQKQRDLIQEEMNNALAHDPKAAEYVDRWLQKNDGLEEFFIKNLENVQGDERDAIFIGTVYGPETPGGPVMQRFGPINGIAGKRRLNVLFSRAKRKIVTFSSMTAANISADENGNVGAHMLKRWLEYSATGVIHAGQQTEREPDSDFEVYVIDQLKAMGCIPVPQVGVAGYFIDIGVKHPSWPHGFILAVECDGAAYHSSRSARDRDRLRQEVLEGLGWSFHRIWSTDWFNDAAKEGARLRAAVEARLKQLNVKS
jgi:hypothetical protein